MELNIIIAGVGGQGNVRAAQILGLAAVKAGFNVNVSDVYGISQRGGAVVSHVRIGDVHGPLVEEHKADIILGLEPMEALRAVARFLKMGGVVILNTRPIYPIEVTTGRANYPDVNEMIKMMKEVASSVIALDAMKIVEEEGFPIALNIAMLGLLAGSGLLPFKPDFIEEAIKEVLTFMTEKNIRAFRAGLKASTFARPSL
ncbi:MAG: indolepyruvate oxidoreductase subunit beta [Candidatus Methanomethyliaceae archaeon]|nr:indolepyruvate oxidoreductase subunit beta [Candidatus Methanomethyliaceae archaeon]MDW7971395.1 indolepyruvate oxidoreductase subunit beta [Nitrososphaerota archaeon]